MKGIKRYSFLASAVAILLALVFSLASCTDPAVQSPAAPEPAELTKDDILENIEKTESHNVLSYDYIYNYFIDWGFPDFDENKLGWAERVFVQHHYYEGGISSLKVDVMPRAAAVARIFLENYYDTIDLSDSKAVTDSLISSLVTFSGDPYSVYRLPEKSDEHSENMSGEFGGIGVVVEYDDVNMTVYIVEVLIGSPAEKAGIKVGDKVYAVDGHLVSEVGHRNAVTYVRGAVGTEVDITVLRGDELLEFTAVRELVTVQTVGYGYTEEKFGYIQVTSFKDNTDEQFTKAIDDLLEFGVYGIIIDLRNNTGGYVQTAVNMLSYLLPSDLPTISYDYKSLTDKTLYTTTDTSSKGESFDSVIDIPIIILTNGMTASAAEIFTSVMRDYGADGTVSVTIIGTTTYKKGIIQSTFATGDGSTISLTTAYYYPPSGQLIHGIGITPDIVIENSETEDLQLFKAVEEMGKLCAQNQ